MSLEAALKKVREGTPTDLDSFLSAFPSQLLFRSKIVPNAGGFAEYIGFAPAGALLTQPVWQIKKLIYDGNNFNTDVLFADGNAKFDKIFNDGSSNYANYTFIAS